MPYTAEHKARTRERIVQSARRLFNTRGFSAVSIDEIMAEAGLTRGGFYNHFRTKEDLLAEAVTEILRLHPGKDWGDEPVDMAEPDKRKLASCIVNAYLSKAHLMETENACSLVAYVSDAALGGNVVKRAYQQVFEHMLGCLQQGTVSGVASQRENALAVVALCVGGMVLARAVADETLADEIRETAKSAALRAGGWPATRSGEMVAAE
ncbi:MAG: TetR/AcrR family transcriptional regulator [Pseudomonadota bacterium]|nr:TetR/AcrR family transcriptional regulator [Pseudomonadota bacterium]